MKKNTDFIKYCTLFTLYLLIGLVLVVCSLFELVDEFWSGMGAALIAVGVLRFIRLARYKANPQYKEKCDTAVTDERNRFLRMKAWSWAGYLFVFLGAIGTIVFRVLEMEREVTLCSSATCLILVLYWVCYWVLNKKY
ncbi:MAG: hypothetical protein E7527_06260 [Ruminococcaceae bacterium]|nr:hypothetical protein [Oscillospiraceae bacterium]